MRLSPNFSLAEMTFSQTADRLGIANTPSSKVIDNLRRLAEALEEVRLWLGKPVVITSGYRCAELNRQIPGSSAHQCACAGAGGGHCGEGYEPATGGSAYRGDGSPF